MSPVFWDLTKRAKKAGASCMLVSCVMGDGVITSSQTQTLFLGLKLPERPNNRVPIFFILWKGRPQEIESINLSGFVIIPSFFILEFFDFRMPLKGPSSLLNL